MFRETHFFAYYLTPVFIRISKAVFFIKTIKIFTAKKADILNANPHLRFTNSFPRDTVLHILDLLPRTEAEYCSAWKTYTFCSNTPCALWNMLHPLKTNRTQRHAGLNISCEK